MSLSVGAGEFVALLGPSGCGKSTLLRLIAGLDQPDGGEVTQPGDNIGYVFQDATLLPWATAAENVWLPLRLHGIGRRDAASRIDAALDRVGLAGFADRRPSQLSGGMRMRVSIARALVDRPGLLLMDEPFAALDEFTRHRLQEDLLALCRDIGCTTIFVTHSIAEAGFLAQRIALMTPRPGRIAEIIASPLAATDPDRRLSPDYQALVASLTQRMRAVAGIGMTRGSTGTALPFAFALGALIAWELAVRLADIPVYLLPGPVAVVQAFLDAPGLLLLSLGSTLVVTFAALLVAASLGFGLAVAMALSHLAKAALQPWVIVLQVTPVVAIAPLIIVWVGDPFTALVVCATIVAFFPVFSSTLTGLDAAPPALHDLFRLNQASRWAELRLLRLPAALPFFLAGLRISGGLALVGAVVAEFVAGSGGFASGLAYRILEAGYRLQIARMFAALALLATAGVAINLTIGVASARLLRSRE